MDSPVVAGTDGSPCADRAVRWAAAEAARRGRRLHLVHAVRPCARDREDSSAEAGRLILGRAASLAGEASSVTTELVLAPPVDALRERAERAAEVVVGHRGLGGFTGLLLGSTGLRLAGRTRCPLVVVRGDSGEDRREVLAGVGRGDGVLEYAFETAAVRGGWVRAVYAWDPAGRDGASLRRALAEAQERLSGLVEPWRRRYPRTRVVEETPAGRPVGELVRRSARADLLVVGVSHGGACLGSVSHGALHHADCPVAVV